MANPFSQLFNQLFGQRAEPNQAGENPLQRLVQENITGPLGINFALEQYAQNLGRAQESQGAAPQRQRTRAPLPDFTSGEVVEPNSAFAWQQDQAAQARQQVAHEVTPHLQALVETGGEYWGQMPPDVQQAVARAAYATMGGPVTDLGVEISEDFVGQNLDDPLIWAALQAIASGSGDYFQQLDSGENPEMRSFTEVEGMPQAAAIAADLGTGLFGGLGELAVGTEAISRVPGAVRHTGQAIDFARWQRQVGQIRRQAMANLADAPTFSKLTPEQQAEVVQIFLNGNPEGEFSRFILGNKLAFEHYELFHELSRAVPALPPPPNIHSPRQNLFEGMDDSEAQDAFRNIADEGEALEQRGVSFGESDALEDLRTNQAASGDELLRQADPDGGALRNAIEELADTIEESRHKPVQSDDFSGAFNPKNQAALEAQWEMLYDEERDALNQIARILGEDGDKWTGLGVLDGINEGDIDESMLREWINIAKPGWSADESEAFIQDLYGKGVIDDVSAPRTKIDPETGEEYEDFGPVSPEEQAALDERRSGPPDMLEILEEDKYVKDVLGGMLPVSGAEFAQLSPKDRSTFINGLSDDPILQRIYRRMNDEQGTVDEMNVANEAIEPGTDEDVMLREAGLTDAPTPNQAADTPDFFSRLEENPEFTVTRDPDMGSIAIEREGAHIVLSDNGDGTFTTEHLARSQGGRGAGSALKGEVLRIADEQGITLRALNAPSGPGDFMANKAKNAARLEAEGYVYLGNDIWERPPDGGADPLGEAAEAASQGRFWSRVSEAFDSIEEQDDDLITGTIGDFRIHVGRPSKYHGLGPDTYQVFGIEAFDGARRGHASLAHLLRAADGEGITLMATPQPYGADIPDEEVEAATQRLVRMYERLGFSMAEDGYMLRPPSP